MKEMELKFNQDIIKRNIIFYDDNQRQVGKLTWNKKGFKFKGNYEKSAKIFFNYLQRFFIKEIK